jgi:nucleotide-binding universal stress UspA family protein
VHILFPFRVAPSGEGALRYLVETYGDDPSVTVTAIHFTDRDPDPPANVATKEIESKSDKHAFEVETVVKRLSKETKASVRDGIIAETNARDSDLVVLGHELSSFFDRARGKRVEDRLLEECRVPVTIVPKP